MFGGFACEMTPFRRQDKLAVSTQSKHCFAAIPGGGAQVFGFFTLLPVELTAVFAVLFEAAKAKFSLCYNRVCLAKNAERFLRVTREAAGIHKGQPPLMHVFFGSFL